MAAPLTARRDPDLFAGRVAHGAQTRAAQRRLKMHRRVGSIAALLAGALLAAGCASFDGLKPQASLEAGSKLRAAEALRSATFSQARWPSEEWWTRFADPQLDGLMTEALSGSPTLRAAEARVRKAQALVGLPRASLAPQLSGNAALTRERFSAHGLVPPPFAGTWNSQNQATLDVHYEFDLWGKNRAAVQSALGQARAAEVDAVAARSPRSVAIAQAYIELERTYDQLEIAQATLSQREQLRQLTDRRVPAGLDSQVELKQAE